MWWTSEGERVLHGAEWELFREGLKQAWEVVEEEIRDRTPYSWLVPVLDDLLPNQKLAMLAGVGEALREESVPCPELTATAEAIIAVVFDQIRASVEIEVDLQGDGADEALFFWRRLVLRGCREVDERWEEPLPEESSADVEEWRLLIDCLAERILWDHDFDMAPDFLDKNPIEAKLQKEEMGIAQVYFSGIAPDPTEKELIGVRRKLKEITSSTRRPGPLAR